MVSICDAYVHKRLVFVIRVPSQELFLESSL